MTYKPKFSCADDEEQFNEKVRFIEIEEQKEIDRNIAIANFNTRVKESLSLDRKLKEIDDDDYQRDVDHDLSMGTYKTHESEEQ